MTRQNYKKTLFNLEMANIKKIKGNKNLDNPGQVNLKYKKINIKGTYPILVKSLP